MPDIFEGDRIFGFLAIRSGIRKDIALFTYVNIFTYKYFFIILKGGKIKLQSCKRIRAILVSFLIPEKLSLFQPSH